MRISSDRDGPESSPSHTGVTRRDGSNRKKEGWTATSRASVPGRLWRLSRQEEPPEVTIVIIDLIGINIIVELAKTFDRQSLKNVPAARGFKLSCASEPTRLREPGQFDETSVEQALAHQTRAIDADAIGIAGGSKGSSDRLEMRANGAAQGVRAGIEVRGKIDGRAGRLLDHVLGIIERVLRLPLALG